MASVMCTLDSARHTSAMPTPVRQLTYGVSADATDKYIRIGESTGSEALKIFCRTGVEQFEHKYLFVPNAAEIKRIEAQFATIGFPGCIGCMDCSG